MRLPNSGFPARLVLSGSLLISGAAGAQESVQPVAAKAPSFWQAASGVAAVNGVTWFYNWHVQRWDWADVGTRSWWANLRGGFTWDDDAFGANQLAHPYHGSLYFNAARASGYGFWGSTPFVAAGSLSWELFTENVRPSANDLINTTLGGIALGEVAYRMSSLLTSRKGPAAGRQMGALVVNPISRAQSLLHGGGRAAPEPAASSSASLSVGQQRGIGAPEAVGGSRPYIGLTFQYGNAFDQHVKRPYDAFEFSLHLSPNEHVVLTHAGVSGLLARRQLAHWRRGQLMLGLFQHYDYDDLPLAKSSSQSLSGALLYRRTMGARTQIDFGLHLEAVPLGAISSDHSGVRRRDYDFGAGVGGRVTGALRRDGRELVRLDARTVWVRSIYGSDANHRLTTARLSAAVPVVRMVSLGGDVSLTLRTSAYRTQPAVSARVPHFRAYLIWAPS